MALLVRLKLGRVSRTKNTYNSRITAKACGHVPNGDPAPVAWNKKNAAMMSTSTMVSILPIHEYYYSIPVKLGGRERGGPGGPLPWRYRGDTIDIR